MIGRKQRSLEFAADWQKRIDDASHLLEPLQEYLQWHWNEAEQIHVAEHPELKGGYERRPTIGLRLQLEGGKTLAIRPGYAKPWTGWTLEETARGEAKSYHPGKLLNNVTTLELLGPGHLFTIMLKEGQPAKRTGWIYDLDSAWDNLRLVFRTAHDLLTDPMHLFSKQADKCCCCNKALTEVESRCRGIGPECIRKFATFQSDKPPSAVDKYRIKYREETGFWK